MTLLPCPFCGAEASWGRVGRTTWDIECSEGCVTMTRAHAGAGAFISEDEAVAAWNRRSTPPASSHYRWRVSSWRDPVVVERRWVRRTKRRSS